MAYATAEEAQAFHPAAEGEYERAEILIEVAGDIVRGAAPPYPTGTTPPEGETEPPGYADKATRAELLVFAWLWDTRGYLSSSSSLVGSSISYQSNPTVLEIVRNTMPEYAATHDTDATAAAATVHNVCPEPLW